MVKLDVILSSIFSSAYQANHFHGCCNLILHIVFLKKCIISAGIMHLPDTSIVL